MLAPSSLPPVLHLSGVAIREENSRDGLGGEEGKAPHHCVEFSMIPALSRVICLIRHPRRLPVAIVANSLLRFGLHLLQAATNHCFKVEGASKVWGGRDLGSRRG